MGSCFEISSSSQPNEETNQIMRVLCFLGLVALAALASAAPAPKAQPTEYISIADVVDATSVIKDIFEQVKAKIESGIVKGEIEDFLKHIKEVVEAKINEAKPVVAEILGQMKAAIEDMIAKVQAGIEQVKPVLQELIEKIMAKIAELYDKLIGGYNIFDDLLNDVLKPALGKAIENLIPTIQKHLGDLIGKLVPSEYVEYLAFDDIMEIVQHIKDVFNELKSKIESGEVQDNAIDFLNKLKATIDAKIEAAKPVVKAILEKVKAAVDEMIAKAKANAEAGIEAGKGLLTQLLEKILAKLAELKDQLTGYGIFDDPLNDVLKPAIKHAIENLIPTISKHLGDLADKLKPAEFIAVTDILEVAQHIKDIFNQLKAKIASGEVKANIVDFLNKLRAVVEAKIAEAKPAVKATLEKVQAAIDEMIAKAQANIEAGIEQGKGLLVQLLEKIMAKLAELKDQVTGYSEFLSITEILEAVADLKDIFEQLKAKIISGEVQDNVIDFLNQIKAVVDAKIAAATPAVKAILEKVDAAVQNVIEKAKAHVESGKGLLVDLLETIIAKIAELKDNIAGYNIFDDLLNDVLKPALKHAIENLIPTIGKHLGDLADKLKPSQ